MSPPLGTTGQVPAAGVNVGRVFRPRARTQPTNEDLDRPLRLVSVPAAVGLVLALAIIAGGAFFLFGGQMSVRVAASGVIVNPPANTNVVAISDGVVNLALAPEDRRVTQGDSVATIRTADGNMFTVVAPLTGVVVSQNVKSRDAVARGTVLLTIAPETLPMVALLFAPVDTVPGITIGDPVVLNPASVDPSKTGTLAGTVVSVSSLPVSPQRVESLVLDPALVGSITGGGVPVHEIVISLQTVPSDDAQLVWTGPGPDQPPVSGEIVHADIVIEEQTPWRVLTGGGAE